MALQGRRGGWGGEDKAKKYPMDLLKKKKKDRWSPRRKKWSHPNPYQGLTNSVRRIFFLAKHENPSGRRVLN